jgi:hypothetical protein
LSRNMNSAVHCFMPPSTPSPLLLVLRDGFLCRCYSPHLCIYEGRALDRGTFDASNSS